MSMTAEHYMTPGVVTIRPEATISEAIELLLNRRISGLPVVDEQGRMIGMITEFALMAMAYDQNIQHQTVAQHMTRDVITVDASDTISRIADLCILHRVRRLPVLDGGRLVGLVSRRDVLQALHTEQAMVC